MKTPKTFPDWLSDVQDAYETALHWFETRTFVDVCSLPEVSRCAAQLAAVRRGIESEDQIESMIEYVVGRVEDDIRRDADLGDHKFHFVISYIHAHTPPEIIDELKADDVMMYVNDYWDLFDDNV